MPLGTQRSQLAEAPVIVFARRQPGFLPNVLVKAIVAIRAVAGSREGLALGHAPQVVFVEVLAFNAFFAEPLEKVFANQ